VSLELVDAALRLAASQLAVAARLMDGDDADEAHDLLRRVRRLRLVSAPAVTDDERAAS
jgi:hypothetical protein